MIYLKDILFEAKVAHTQKSLQWVYHDYIPMTPKVIKQIMGDTPITTFHNLDWFAIKNQLPKVVGSKKSVSTYNSSKNMSMLMGGGVQTKGGIVLELEGKVLDENLIKKIKAIGSTIKANLKKGMEKKNQQIDNINNNPVKGYSQTLQMNGQKPEGEVIKEEEKENPTFVQFMKRIDQLPEVTREAIKNCGNDPAIAKAALEISGIDK